MGRKQYEQMEVGAKGSSFGKFMKLFEREDCRWMRLIRNRRDW